MSILERIIVYMLTRLVTEKPTSEQRGVLNIDKPYKKPRTRKTT